MKAIERGAPNKGLDNLFNFWSTKIRENLTNFFTAQKLLVLIDEIDQKIVKYEEKKKSADKDRITVSRKNKYTTPYQYKPVIKDKEKNQKTQSKNYYYSKYDEKQNKVYNSSTYGTQKYGKKTTPTNNIEEKEKEIKAKSPENKSSYKMENNTSLNNLENSLFNFQQEKLGENILEMTKKNKNIISFIDIDLFLQRIAQEKKIYDDMNDNDILLKGFCIQHPIFIQTNTLISKIISCFSYFYKIYQNQNNEKDLNANIVEKNYQANNNRQSSGYRGRYKQIKNNQKEDNIVFIKKPKKLPYWLIDLIILFVDLNEKYSKEILTKEIIEKIENFYKTLLSINEVKSKYKDDIGFSSRVLTGINNRAILKRVKTYRRKIEYEKLFSISNLLDNKIRDPNKPLSFFNILNFNAKDIAKELTRISYHLFSKIQPKEFFKGVFTKKNKNVTSPNITEVANKFNKLSFWLIEEILSYDYGNDRAQVIEKFIDVANELINLNNFNDAMSIVSGLGHMIVNNLVKSWKYVSKNSNITFQNLKQLLNFQDNYKNIRDRIDECLQNNQPYIPFLGPYNKRICFLEEYGPYVKNNSLINVDKIVLVQEILDQFYKFKGKQYEIIRSNKNEFLIFQCLDPVEESELEKLSSFLEPNFVLRTKKTHEKRVTNTENNFKENYEKNEELI